ncbi:MAG TPA: LLM class F420-dependent oxidoreductase [Acidimicrobiales bacterium]
MTGFGIQLPVQAQSPVFASDWERDAGPVELVRIARAAEAAGLSYVAVCDHVAIPRERAEAMGTTWYDTVATLGFLAGVTTRVGLMSHVAVLGYRHPLVTAKQWATLDALSGGRAILGVGAGHVEGEFAALGLDFAARGARLDEAIDAVRAALADEFSSHHGPVWSYDDMAVRPRPVQARIPIWVGGSTPAAIRRAAERGDGWLPQGPPSDGMAAGIARLHALREAAGRAEEPFTVGALSGPLHVGTPSWDVGRCVKGSPEKLAGYLRSLVDLGVDQIQVAFRSRDAAEQCDQLAAFGAEVLPLVVDGDPAPAPAPDPATLEGPSSARRT